MNVSSVSPERWLTMTPQPFSWASLHLHAHTSTDPQPLTLSALPSPNIGLCQETSGGKLSGRGAENQGREEQN